MRTVEGKSGFEVRHLGAIPSDIGNDDNCCSVAFVLAEQRLEFTGQLDRVANLIISGCISFVIWGECSDDVEDTIDSVIEDLGELYFGVTTVSLKGESLDEAIDFFCNTKIWQAKNIKCYIVFPEHSKHAALVTEKLMRFIAKTSK